MPKCGTVSLESYLRERFPGKEARRIEQIWIGDVTKVKEKRPELLWHYVIILRDNVERIWSNYHYFDHSKDMTLKEYLNYDTYGFRMGVANPIKQGDYRKWLEIWAPLDPIIVTLEDMKKYPGFPHENKTSKNRDYPNITETDKALITSYLNKKEISN